MTRDVHNLTGDAADLRRVLLEVASIERASAIAELLTNRMVARANEAIGAGTITSADSLLAYALIANALLDIGGQWWASDSGDPRAIPPTTIAVLRSFTTDLPPMLNGYSYDTSKGDLGA